MQLLRSGFFASITALTIFPQLGRLVSASSGPPFCALKPSFIKNSQPLKGKSFIGTSVSAHPLRPKFVFEPQSSTLHADNGNSGSVDYPGPLGRNLKITTNDLGYSLFYWGADGTMFAIYAGSCNGSDTNIVQAITVVDPETLDFLASWELPAKYAKSQLNFSYMQVVMETNQVVISTAEGQIFILQKCEDANGSPTIELRRLIDLTPSGVLKGYTLLNTMMDGSGNTWFTTGAVDGVGSGVATNGTIIGYVEPDGTIHSLDEIPNQSVGNGISLSNTTIFVNTEPSAKDDHANAMGYILSLQPGQGTSVQLVWNATYQAGSSKKPGAFARGSGTSPTLLGNDFVAVADNSDVQINLLILPQNANGDNVQPVCTVPLWHPNASWTDNGAMVHYDGKDYGVVLNNMYKAPSFDTQNKTNGPYNNLTRMAPGISKFTVAGDGSECHLTWTNPGRTTTVTILSTKTGLIYGYEQSNELAYAGEYVWYATAMDYGTGKTVWKARTGAGGIFNNQYRTTFLNPNGALYQMVQGGVVIIKDGE